jgi:Domain of Unknown Function (DUF1543)
LLHFGQWVEELIPDEKGHGPAERIRVPGPELEIQIPLPLGIALTESVFVNRGRPVNKKLFAVYLGGRAPKCNTELHDVVFVVGDSIEDTYDRLMDQWFGNPLRVHLDSWLELQIVDGHRISLRAEPSTQPKKLYFINLGAYMPGQFTELHANAFAVAASERDVKTRAKGELLQGTQSVHTDDLFDIDDCLEVTEVDGHHIHLEPTSQSQPFAPNNGYHVIPPSTVAAYAQKRGITAPKPPA